MPLPKSKQKASQSGFTLIELLVVISVISLLSSIVMTSVATARRSARDVIVKTNVNTLVHALQVYAGDNRYPPVNNVSNDNSLGDSGFNLCGTQLCDFGSLTQQALVNNGYLSRAIVFPQGSYQQWWYFHKIGPVAAQSMSQRIFNYCSMGGACGFKNPNTTLSYCWSNSGNNPDGTPAEPAAEAAIFFQLERGVSPDYPSTNSSFFPGNAICLN